MNADERRFHDVALDNEGAVGLRLGHVDDPQLAARFRPADGDPGALLASAIFAAMAENLLHLMFPHAMIVDVRKARVTVNGRTEA